MTNLKHYCRTPPEQRFHEFYISEALSGCWLWIGATCAFGYGRIIINRKSMVAHRYSYKLHFGQLPKNRLVCHACDVPSCVNPHHLFLGTYKDNWDDMFKKGRHKHGRKHPGAKLSEEQVLAIYRDSRPQRIVANTYGVSQALISAIKTKKLWAPLLSNSGC